MLAQVGIGGREDSVCRDSAAVALGDERETLGSREIHAHTRTLAAWRAPPRAHGAPPRRRGGLAKICDSRFHRQNEEMRRV